MEGWPASGYGDAIAHVYDELGGAPADTAATVSFLLSLSHPATAVELGAGTGRVALPLAEAGVAVTSVEISKPMIDELCRRPGAENLTIVQGDMASYTHPHQVPLVYTVFNSLLYLTSQADQLACMSKVAGYLAPGGSFVVEALVPDPSIFDHGQRLHVFGVNSDRCVLAATTYDAVTQVVALQHIVLASTGVQMFPGSMRLIWPAELDLMARLAGLELAGRYAGWQREAFTVGSMSHVSVYRPA